MPLAAIILAAGQGTRFKSARAKLLHPLLGRPMIRYPLDLARKMKLEPLIVVVGHQAEALQEACHGQGVVFVLQAEQKGTGHAVACAAGALKGFEGDVLILSGDVPLLKAETMAAFVAAHRRKKARVSFVAAKLDDPAGYGRVVSREGAYEVIEDKDATAKQRRIKDINVGLYAVEASFLFEALAQIEADNAQGEYYLPDVIRLAGRQGLKTAVYWAEDAEEVRGVNDRRQLAQVEARLRQEKIEALMLAGVTCQDPRTLYLDFAVAVGRDTFLGAGVHLLGRSVIGQGVIIEPHCWLKDVVVGDGARVRFGNRLEGLSVAPGGLV